MIRFPLLLIVIVVRMKAQQEPAPAVGTTLPQPLPFSHRAHTELGLKCSECHKGAAQGPAAGIPPESLCMNCHRTVKAQSPAIVTLAGFLKRSEPVPWARLYRLPDFVFFSHKREKSISMQSCMACHDKRKANNNCDTCHTVHPA